MGKITKPSFAKKVSPKQKNKRRKKELDKIHSKILKAKSKLVSFANNFWLAKGKESSILFVSNNISNCTINFKSEHTNAGYIEIEKSARINYIYLRYTYIHILVVDLLFELFDVLCCVRERETTLWLFTHLLRHRDIKLIGSVKIWIIIYRCGKKNCYCNIMISINFAIVTC